LPRIGPGKRQIEMRFNAGKAEAVFRSVPGAGAMLANQFMVISLD
jgi:hypothetical protein